MKRRFTFRTLCAGLAAPLLLAFSGSAQGADTIKVGVLHALSGTMAISETTLKDTVLMLVDEQNKKGGLLGKKLEAMVVDPASNWPLFAEKARELLANTCLMGRNGMGKTTLLRSIMGLALARSGEILFEGETDLRKFGAEARAGLGIGYVPQGREIFSQLSVEENLRTGLIAKRERPADALERVYSTFPVLKQMLRRRGGDLSGGQQQLAIGRALLLQPKLLILDEPCEGIQPNIVHEIGDLLLRLNQEAGLIVLIVEQKLPFARRIASDFRILDKGRLVAGGSIGELSDEMVRHHLTV